MESKVRYWTKDELDLIKDEYLEDKTQKAIRIYEKIQLKGFTRSYDAFLTKFRILKASLEKDKEVQVFEKHRKYDEYTEEEKEILKRVVNLFCRKSGLKYTNPKKYSYMFLYKKALNLGLNRPFDGFVKKIKEYMTNV